MRTFPEEARLHALFHRLLLASAMAGPVSCSQKSGTSPTQLPQDDAGGTTPSDAMPPAVSGESGEPDDGAAPAAMADAGPPDVTEAGYGFDDAACDPQEIDAAICTTTFALPCGLPPDAATEGCYLALAECGVLCNQAVSHACGIYECLSVDGGTVPEAGPMTLECATGALVCGVGVGRRPEGLSCERDARPVNAVAALLAEMARLEAGSVAAFRRFAAELTLFGAPRGMVHSAERAARDEVRHARVAARLARRRGAKPGRVEVRHAQARSLEAFAVENAVEGCVRECFGALVATRQAMHAPDPDIRAVMRPIAEDETRHAALAWKVARWVTPRLSEADRLHVGRAMRGAVRALRCEVANTPADVAAALGLPSGEEGCALVDAFAAALLRG